MPKVPDMVRLNWSRKFCIRDWSSCLLLEISQQLVVVDFVVPVSESVLLLMMREAEGEVVCISLSSEMGSDAPGSSQTVKRRMPRELPR